MISRKVRDQVIGHAVAELDELDYAEEALQQGAYQSASEHLQRARQVVIDLDVPVSVAQAAGLLEVSEPTVREWMQAGILETLGLQPVKLSFRSVAKARTSLRSIRLLGQVPSVRQALLDRIDDQLTLQDPRLRKSIEEMRSGTGQRHYVHRRETV